MTDTPTPPEQVETTPDAADSCVKRYVIANAMFAYKHEGLSLDDAIERTDATIAEALELLTAKLSASDAEVARLQDSVVELWHDSATYSGELREALCQTREQHAAWVNPDAFARQEPEGASNG